MDPQQRLLLEATWEAIEDGGQVLDLEGGTDTGVFIGISTTDYSSLQSSPNEAGAVDAYTTTGSTNSIAANRISYCFNFLGPSVAIDTACSSALVALHAACRSLRNGECTMAVAGGVNALLDAGPFIAFSSMSMLSPDGKCKAFDAAANGFVRGEGVGAILLKPLDAARADGDRIYAVIRATGVNQDGRSAGLTVPSFDSQKRLIETVCREAGVEPGEIQYAEAHGTGTAVGDPIEARALGAALGQGRGAGEECVIGSAKTNIGHLEAGAGIAGVIKVALMLKHGAIPPSLHFKTPNPEIDFAGLKLRVAQQLEPFPGTSLRRACVNSFGFGGTNGHALLEQAASPEDEPVTNRLHTTYRSYATERPELLLLSARSSKALKAAALSHAQWLESEIPLRDLCATAATHRNHHKHRVSIAASSRAQIVETLNAFAEGNSVAGLTAGEALSKPRLVFVFSGQGPQRPQMGTQLFAKEPVFRATIEQCHEILRSLGDWSLIDELHAGEMHSRMSETAIAQPAICAIQLALAALWRSWGVRPDAVVGHSVGEVAAAHEAGVLSLPEAMRIIFHRGRCMDHASASGRMLAAALVPEQAREIVSRYEGAVSLAAINGPASVTFSGDAGAIEDIALALEIDGVFCRPVPVNYAFHSAQMDPVQSELLAALNGSKPQPALVPIYSTVTGQLASDGLFERGYWWRNVRETVQFAPAIERLLESGHNLFVEIAPHPVLSGSVRECAKTRKIAVVPSMRRKMEERLTMVDSLGALYAEGAGVEWKRFYDGGYSFVALPRYPWQRQRHWHETADWQKLRLHPPSHPLLARKLDAADPVWTLKLAPRVAPYLEDHRVQGHALLPAAAYVEMAFGAERELFGDTACQLEEVEFHKPFFLSTGEEVPMLQLVQHSREMTFAIHSRMSEQSQAWTLHASGKMRVITGETAVQSSSRESILERCREEIDGEHLYAALKESGLEFGPAFQGMERVWRADGEALGLITLTEPASAEAARYLIHPALLDACFQVVSATLPLDREEAVLFLPTQIERIRLHRAPPSRLWSHVRLRKRYADAIEADFDICSDAGELVVEIRGFRCTAVDRTRTAAQNLESLFYEQRWLLRPLPEFDSIRCAADFIPETAELCLPLQAEAERLSRELGTRERSERYAPRSDQLCRGFVLNAFAALGWRLEWGERVSVPSLLSTMRILPKYERLLGRYLYLFEQQGLLRRAESDWIVVRAPETIDLDEEWRALVVDFPGLFPEFSLMERRGKSLAAVLRGEVDSVEAFLADDAIQNLEYIYSNSDSSIVDNSVARSAIDACVAALPQGRRLRILEVGAGTGGLTSFLLPLLPPDRVEYHFTDISRMFFAKAEQRASDFPFLECRVLDIEKDPTAQGFQPHHYDIVLASNALHATTDLRETLRNVRKLLTSRGLLLLIEVDRSDWFYDLVFGTTDGLWKFTDTDLRPDYPLLTRQRWLELLGEMEFEEAVAVSDRNCATERSQALFLARAPLLPDEPEAPGATPPSETGTWLLFSDEQGCARDLARLIRARGGRALLVRRAERSASIGEDEFEAASGDASAMVGLLETIGPCRGVVHLGSLDAFGGAELTSAEIEAAQALSTESILSLSQALTKIGNPGQLFVVTRGAQPVDISARGLSMAQTTVCGLARVITSEHPSLRCRIIDLSPNAGASEARLLLAELCCDEQEQEVAFRNGARYVQRFATASVRDRTGSTALDVRNHPCRIEAPKPGVLDHLVLRAIERRLPGAGEVEIEVAAAGLNFRDVMKALGIYPAVEGDAGLLGDECSGRIVAVGAGVTGFAVGDEVCAIARGAFASHVVTPAAFVMPKPAHFLMAEAATVLVTFLTAHYALHHLGRMRAGERVLIHAAAGGVGLAAVQLALAAGAEVFATAGNPEKRALLERLGVRHVMNSRTLSFAEEIMDETAGRGVDIVLNSLAGDAIGKSLSVLAPSGRFLEIGKRDIYENTRIGLRPFRNNLSYFAIDLGGALETEMIGQFLRDLRSQFESGRLRPLPYRTYSSGNFKSAFHSMAQGKHVGKVVLAWSGAKVRMRPASDARSLQIRQNATYLISGGLGGFGLATAKWLVANGARHVVLTSRTGQINEEARAALDSCEKMGAQIAVMTSDVSSESEIAQLFASIAANMPPLAGVVHAAMVLDDCLLTDLDPKRLHKVLAPKMSGAWNLHRQTRELPLDFFLLYSSMSSVIGNRGQANYAAANSFLDALSHHRRALQLPALAINWGAIGEVGYVARNEQVREHLARNGWDAISLREAFAAIELLLRSDIAQMTVLRVDFEHWRQVSSGAMDSLRYSLLATAMASEAGDHPDDGASIRAAIASAPPSARPQILESFLTEQIARVLRTSAANIEREKPLTEIGLDSLMAVELLNRIESRLGVIVVTADLMSGPTVVRLAAVLADRFGGNAASAPPNDSARSNGHDVRPIPVPTSERVAPGSRNGKSVNGSERSSLQPDRVPSF